jgi:hypothetical protein
LKKIAGLLIIYLRLMNSLPASESSGGVILDKNSFRQ